MITPAEVAELLKESYETLAHAHARIHCLPRTSDTELAKKIEHTRAAIETVLSSLDRQGEAKGIARALDAAHPSRAASAWRPIETAPKMKTILLWALVDERTGNWKMETGYSAQGYQGEDDTWVWDGRRLKSYDHQPTHWMPLPEPPEMGAQRSGATTESPASDRVAKLEEALRAYEKWEADLILSNAAWDGSLPRFTHQLWDGFITIQKMRNAALSTQGETK